MATVPSDWVLGLADEVWWLRLAQPALQAWVEGQPLRLHELTRPKADPKPKAIACYGILHPDIQEVLVGFVDGRPVSHVTTAFLQGVCAHLKAEGKKVLWLGWDKASWHRRQEV